MHQLLRQFSRSFVLSTKSYVRPLATTTPHHSPISTEQLLLRATAGDPTYTARTLIELGSKSNPEALIPHTATRAVCDTYNNYTHDAQRTNFLVTLARDMNLDDVAVATAVGAASQINPGTAPERVRRVTTNLRKTLTPAYETLFSRMLAQVPGGMMFLVQLRADLLRNIRTLSKHADSTSDSVDTLRYLKDLDTNLKRNMVEWFSMSFLRLERVTMDMPGTVLDQIVQEEKVHPIENFGQLRLRLGHGRRCYAFFHPSLPKIPLAFVHVALLDSIADGMNVITGKQASTLHEEEATSAIFYSISSTQPGLSGVDLGNFLIKRVAQDIQETLPNVQHYSTLSPIPNFSAWMKRAGVDLLKQGQISNVSSHDGALVAQELEKNNHMVRAKECAPRTTAVLGKAAAHYIVHEKLRGKMLCPVGNFHVRNGAEAWRLNVEVK